MQQIRLFFNKWPFIIGFFLLFTLSECTAPLIYERTSVPQTFNPSKCDDCPKVLKKQIAGDTNIYTVKTVFPDSGRIPLDTGIRVMVCYKGGDDFNTAFLLFNNFLRNNCKTQSIKEEELEKMLPNYNDIFIKTKMVYYLAQPVPGLFWATFPLSMAGTLTGIFGVGVPSFIFFFWSDNLRSKIFDAGFKGALFGLNPFLLIRKKSKGSALGMYCLLDIYNAKGEYLKTYKTGKLVDFKHSVASDGYSGIGTDELVYNKFCYDLMASSVNNFLNDKAFIKALNEQTREIEKIFSADTATRRLLSLKMKMDKLERDVKNQEGYIKDLEASIMGLNVSANRTASSSLAAASYFSESSSFFSGASQLASSAEENNAARRQERRQELQEELAEERKVLVEISNELNEYQLQYASIMKDNEAYKYFMEGKAKYNKFVELQQKDFERRLRNKDKQQSDDAFVMNELKKATLVATDIKEVIKNNKLENLPISQITNNKEINKTASGVYKNRDIALTILNKCGKWKVNSSVESTDFVQPQCNPGSSQYDAYVCSAVSAAFAAECYYSYGTFQYNGQTINGTEYAEKYAASMMNNLLMADDLCSESASIASSTLKTTHIWPCNKSHQTITPTQPNIAPANTGTQNQENQPSGGTGVIKAE